MQHSAGHSAAAPGTQRGPLPRLGCREADLRADPGAAGPLAAEHPWIAASRAGRVQPSIRADAPSHRAGAVLCLHCVWPSALESMVKVVRLPLCRLLCLRTEPAEMSHEMASTLIEQFSGCKPWPLWPAGRSPRLWSTGRAADGPGRAADGPGSLPTSQSARPARAPARGLAGSTHPSSPHSCGATAGRQRPPPSR